MATNGDNEDRKLALEALGRLDEARKLKVESERVRHDLAEAWRAWQACEADLRKAVAAGDRAAIAKHTEQRGILKLRHHRQVLELRAGLQRLEALRQECVRLQQQVNKHEAARRQPEKEVHHGG